MILKAIIKVNYFILYFMSLFYKKKIFLENWLTIFSLLLFCIYYFWFCFLASINKTKLKILFHKLFFFFDVGPKCRKQEKISRIRETLNLSTNADSRTYTILEKLRDFFLKIFLERLSQMSM